MAMQNARRRVLLAVGIIILAVSTVALISIVKQRGEAVRHEEMTKIAEEQVKELEASTDASPSKDSNTQAAPESSEAPASTPTLSGEAAAELPQTGPVSILSVVPLAAIGFMGVSYIQSRRAAARSAL